MRNVLAVVFAMLVSVTGGCIAPSGSDDLESISLGLVGVEPPLELRIDAGLEDIAHTVITDSAGNAYVGTSINDTTNGFAVVKYDSRGSRVWTALHGGSLGTTFGRPQAVALDRSGNVFAAGTVHTITSTQFSITGLLVKFSPTGAELWVRKLDAAGGPIAMALDSAGNAVTAGNTGFQGDVAVQKYASSGAPIWSRTFNGTRSMSADTVSGLAIDRADNVIIAGSTQSTGSVNEATDVFAVKYDPAGNVLWTRTFGRTPETDEKGRDLALDENGALYIAAAARPDAVIDPGELATPVLLKYDAGGNLQFAKLGDGFGGRSVVADGRGRVYTVGDSPAHVSAFDLNGTRLWTTPLRAASELAVSPDGDIVVGGAHATSQLDSNGALLGEHTSTSIFPNDVEIDAFGSAYVAGEQRMGGSGGIAQIDALTLKFAIGRIGNPPPPPPPPPPVTTPAAPSSLTSTATSRSSVSLSWRDNANNEQGVRIERCTGRTCTSFARIADTGANAVSFVDPTVRSSTSYRYRVRAFNSAGSSAFSNIVSVRTPFR